MGATQILDLMLADAHLIDAVMRPAALTAGLAVSLDLAVTWREPDVAGGAGGPTSGWLHLAAEAGPSDDGFTALHRGHPGPGRHLTGHCPPAGPGSSGVVLPMSQTRRYVITEPCVDCKDGACVDACPVDCIYEGVRMFYIHPDECVGCGAFEWACPVEAAYCQDDPPAKWRHYAGVNTEFTRALGSPLGARRFGPVADDLTIHV